MSLNGFCALHIDSYATVRDEGGQKYRRHGKQDNFLLAQRPASSALTGGTRVPGRLRGVQNTFRLRRATKTQKRMRILCLR